MAGNAFKKVVSGEKLQIHAAAWNRVLELTARGPDLTGKPSTPSFRQATIVRVKNDSGAAVGRFGVLGIDEPLIDPDDNEEEFQSQVMFTCSTPAAAHAGNFVITLDPIAAGEIGRAVIAGVTVARLTGEDVGFAEIDSGNRNYLEASATGSAQVLWAAAGTGLRWAVVRLNAPAAAEIVTYRYYCIGGALQEFEVAADGSLTYIRDVSCCSTDCEEIEACVDDCDADDVGSPLCLHFEDREGYTTELRDTRVTITETGANVWTGSGTTPDGLGTVEVLQMIPVNGGGWPCGLWMIEIEVTHPNLNGGTTFVMHTGGANAGILNCESGSPRILFGLVNGVGGAAYARVYDDECSDGSGSGGGGDCTSVEVSWGALSCPTMEIACTQTVQASGATDDLADIPAVFGLTYHSSGTFQGHYVSNDLGIHTGPCMLLWVATGTTPAATGTFFLVDENGDSLATSVIFTGAAQCFADGSFYIEGILELSPGGELAAGSVSIIIDGEAA